jgi:oxalate decarboxylase/phosphoglucose isomerase-like protein (cupin superfamily)
MPGKQLRFGRGFSVALRNRRAQAATMVLEPGATEGGPDNAHRGSDQWLVLIERGVTHEIRNAGRPPLKTLNLYVPPAYSASGRPLSRGRP